jgi:hypothetical protein
MHSRRQVEPHPHAALAAVQAAARPADAAWRGFSLLRLSVPARLLIAAAAAALLWSAVLWALH